jgi:hypothetical protein
MASYTVRACGAVAKTPAWSPVGFAEDLHIAVLLQDWLEFL